MDMASPDFTEPAPEHEIKNLITRLERSAEITGRPDLWIRELTEAAERLHPSTARLRSIATHVTWIARRCGQPVPTGGELCGDVGIGGLLHLYACGQRFRFDFNFSRLAAFLSQHQDSPHAADALVQSFSAFAKLGAREPDAVAQLRHVLGLSDLDTRARQVCLAGLWSAYTLPEQGTLMLDLANAMIQAGEADGTVYFRRAAAHRILREFSAALDDIDHAMSMLPPGNNEIHQDYLRERQLIGLAIQTSSKC
jgi:hypothetical protein